MKGTRSYVPVPMELLNSPDRLNALPHGAESKQTLPRSPFVTRELRHQLQERDELLERVGMPKIDVGVDFILFDACIVEAVTP